ncbi:hypothetical protein HanPI659440_Chr02g0088871 [Helianthus annuus]|nr:hypothetical protein HanPI659440_Chr02g0088871 [Helianthus annuus]
MRKYTHCFGINNMLSCPKEFADLWSCLGQWRIPLNTEVINRSTIRIIQPVVPLGRWPGLHILIKKCENVYIYPL